MTMKWVSLDNYWLTVSDEIWLWDNKIYIISVTYSISNVSETDQTDEKQ